MNKILFKALQPLQHDPSVLTSQNSSENDDFPSYPSRSFGSNQITGNGKVAGIDNNPAAQTRRTTVT